MVFYRVLQLAVAHEPVRYQDLIASEKPDKKSPKSPGRYGSPSSISRCDPIAAVTDGPKARADAARGLAPEMSYLSICLAARSTLMPNSLHSRIFQKAHRVHHKTNNSPLRLAWVELGLAALETSGQPS